MIAIGDTKLWIMVPIRLVTVDHRSAVLLNNQAEVSDSCRIGIVFQVLIFNGKQLAHGWLWGVTN